MPVSGRHAPTSSPPCPLPARRPAKCRSCKLVHRQQRELQHRPFGDLAHFSRRHQRGAARGGGITLPTTVGRIPADDSIGLSRSRRSAGVDPLMRTEQLTRQREPGNGGRRRRWSGGGPVSQGTRELSRCPRCATHDAGSGNATGPNRTGTAHRHGSKPLQALGGEDGTRLREATLFTPRLRPDTNRTPLHSIVLEDIHRRTFNLKFQTGSGHRQRVVLSSQLSNRPDTGSSPSPSFPCDYVEGASHARRVFAIRRRYALLILPSSC